MRSLIASETNENGDVDNVISDCDIVLEHSHHSKAFKQTMIEKFRTCTSLDSYGGGCI
ncbi:MAG: hypothetical protein HUJ51_01890 [Eggerthellaceae bacterium]|nr:hypothetical protein [Eggerthellaceae bacterium]